MSLRLSNFPIVVNTAGKTNNPTTATVMADTGALTNAAGSSGTYEVLVIVSADATAIFQVEHRNIANAGNVDSAVVLFVAANSPVAVPFRYFVKMDDTGGERIRVMMNANLTGNAAATVISQRVA